MSSMTFTIDDQWTSGTAVENGAPQPRVQVTISENGDGTLSFQVGILSTSEWTGDLRAFYFDVLGDRNLTISGATTNVAGAAIVTDTDGTVTDLGDPDASTNPLVANNQGGNWDAGLLLGEKGYDGITSLFFSLAATDGSLSLADFAGQTFGIRVKSTDDLSTTNDEGGSSKIIEFTSPVLGVSDDDACVDENATTTGNVFANDTNAAGNLNSLTSGTGTFVLANAEGATFTLNADGSYTLDASTADKLSAGEHLEYTFNYDAKSVVGNDLTSWSTDSGTITICVYGVNDGPVAVDDATGCVDENTTQTGGSVVLNDTDVDRLDTLSFVSWAAGTGTHSIANGAGATATLNADGTWSVDASTADALSEGEHITQDFTYTMTDNHGATSSAVLTVEVCGVNDGPVALDDAAGCIDEDGAIVNASVTANDSDVDRLDTHTYTLIDGSFNGQGNLTFNADGSWSYDPAGAYDYLNEGGDVDLSFQYIMTDDQGSSDTATVSFCVQGVGGGSDHFPNQPKDISNIVLYFNDDAPITGDTRGDWLTQTLKGGKTKVSATADGVYTVKIDVPGSFSDDLDETIDSILSYVESHGLDPNAELVGVAVKGGNVDHGGYHNFYALDGDPEPEYVWGGDNTTLIQLTGRSTLALDNEIDATIAYSSVFPA